MGSESDCDQTRKKPVVVLDEEVIDMSKDDDNSDEEAAEKLYQEGREKHSKNDYFGAIDLFKQAIEKNPEKAEYYDSLAKSEVGLGKTSDAIASLKKFVHASEVSSSAKDVCSPQKLKGLIRLGKLLFKSGDLTEALDILIKAEKIDPTNSVIASELRQVRLVKQVTQAANESLNAGDFSRAKALADSGLSHVPTSRELNMVRMRCLIQAGDFDQAFGVSTKLMRELPNDSEVLLYRAQCLYYQENFISAIRHLQQSLSLDPDNKVAQKYIRMIRKLEKLKEKGNNAFKTGQWQEAVDSYSQCLEEDSSNKLFMAKLYCNRAAAYQKLKRPIEALVDSNHAIELNPDYGKAHLRRAASLRALGGEDNLGYALHSYNEAQRILGNSREIAQDIRDTKLELKKAKRKDYYALLELPDREASTSVQIKKAYKKVALKWHPDRHSNSTEEEKQKAENMFKEVSQAYDVLSNPEKRQKYDSGQSLEEIEQGVPNMGGFDPNELFSMYFGGARANGASFRF